MAHAHKTVSSPKPPAEVFAYLADFSTTAEWDPGISTARRLDDGPLGVGNRVELDAGFFGRTITLIYETTLYEAPHRFIVRGESSTVVSVDEITVEADGAGSLVTYDAELTLKGALKIFDPALSLGFGKVADKAIAGLRKALSA
jgi:carbon monoxide dehydrogenase subunit G